MSDDSDRTVVIDIGDEELEVDGITIPDSRTGEHLGTVVAYPSDGVRTTSGGTLLDNSPFDITAEEILAELEAAGDDDE